jgi:hypothetical protein
VRGRAAGRLLAGEVLDCLFREAVGAGRLTGLDCCCAIGTQAIGLVLLGNSGHGTDLNAQQC